MESHGRSIIKAITFRILATIVTMVLVWYYTGNLALANMIGLADIVIKFGLYYFHERAWNSIQWGRRIKHPSSA